MTTVLIAISFVVLVVTGAVMFLSPPGRIANWTNWNVLGLRKSDWTGLHIGFSALFLVVAGFHLFFNWRPMVSYFKDRLTRRLGLRREWAAALGIGVLVFAGTRAGIPPFSTLLAWNEELKESWDQPAARAPIPHAELLTFTELAEKGGVAPAMAATRLEAKGIKGFAPDTVVQQIADAAGVPAQRVYEIMLAEDSAKEGVAAGRGGPGAGRGQGQGAAGAGGGPGRKTLTQFCAEEGIAVKEALARLEAKGFKAQESHTLREIAENNGFEKPYGLIEIIRAQ